MDLRVELGWKSLYSALLPDLSTKISGESLISFLRTHAIPCDSTGVKAVFKVFDRDRDGLISYSDFLETIKLIYKGTSSRSNTLIDRKTDLLEGKYRRPWKSAQKRFDQSPIRARESASPSEFRASKEELILAFEDVSTNRFSVSPKYSRKTSPKLVAKQYFPDADHPCKLLLFQFFNLQLSLLRDLEAKKHALSLRIDFHPWTCFELLSPSHGKYLTLQHIETGLGQLGVKTEPSSLRRVMLAYNCSSDGKLKYSEFVDMLAAQSFRPSRTSPVSLRPDTIHCLSSVYSSIIDTETKIESARVGLSINPTFKCSGAFSVIDSEGKGSVSKDEFQRVLTANRLCATDQEAFALFKRYDKNRDGKVTFAEFVQEVASFAVKDR